MRSSRCCFGLIVIVLSLLFCGCVSPRIPPLRCTVLLEDNPGLLFEKQVYEVRQGENLTFSVGIPSGDRIESLNYPDYSVSAKTGSSANFDYYTITLHQIQYETLIRITTARGYTTAYHGDAFESISVNEESPHLRFNTLPYREDFMKQEYLPIGWNTQPDGSGTAVSFGSRIDHREVSHLDLYIQYLPCSAAADFTYELSEQGAVITGYHGTGDVVIPAEIDGHSVTTIASGAFDHLNVRALALPPTVKSVERGAFGNVEAEHFYFFDSIETLPEDAFASYRIQTLHIQAVKAPSYSGTYFDTLPDKMDYLYSIKDHRKIVLFCGSSARFGYDSPMIEEALSDYRVANMGVYAYTNMRPFAQMLLPYMNEGDILLSSPELDAIDKQFCGSNTLEKETFCMVESNYDLLTLLDLRDYTGIFDAFQSFNDSRQRMSPRSYNESASDYDEDGVPQLTETYNLYGDYILFRPNNTDRISFGVKRAYYNKEYISAQDLDGLNGVYDAFSSLGIRVLFTYSPRSAISISPDSTEETIRELDTFLREQLHAPVISPIEDSLIDPYYFYATDNHLSTEGVAVHTARIISYLRAVLEE